MLILFGIKSIAFPLIIKINAELFLLNLTDEDIEKEEVLLFLLLWMRRRRQKCKKKRKNQDFGLQTFFVKGNNTENIATSAGTENWRLRILF